MTRDELQLLYEQGPDAVYAEIVHLQGTIETLSTQVQQLTARVQALEARLGKDSHNSSKPPSSDGLGRGKPQPKSLRQTTGRAPGGQIGHPGHTLAMVDNPDERVQHRAASCAECGFPLGEARVESCERRQVFDLPPLRLQVTEHQALCCECPRCHALTPGAFPAGVTLPAQYGPGVLGFTVYLSQYQLLPMARTEQLVADLFGQAPCQGTLETALGRCFQTLAPVEAAIKEALRHARVVGFDETGIRVARALHWLHVACNDRLTFYLSHAKRGRKAHEAVGILPTFQGTAEHDALSSYLVDDYSCQHGLCNGHLLRELVGQWETTHQTWTQRMSALLRALYREKCQAQQAGLDALAPQRLGLYCVAYRRIVQRGLVQNPAPEPTHKQGRPAKGPTRCLLERLQTREEAVLRFAFDFAVPFDNNQAERDLRMVKVHQKISGCFRSPQGAEHFCRIRGYISTLRKQHADVMDGLRSVLAGNPIYPAMVPP